MCCSPAFVSLGAAGEAMRPGEATGSGTEEAECVLEKVRKQ